MYYEWLFYNNEMPVNGQVEALAQWVQWAQTSLAAGPSENEETVRYNLNQFWTEKNFIYSTLSADARAQVDKLDIRANGLLNALNAGKVYSAPPSVVDQISAWFTGGTPDRPAAVAAALEAKQAAQSAADTSARLGDTQGQTYWLNQVASADAALTDAGTMWQESSPLSNPLGVPLWIWGVVAVGVIIIVVKK
jgi:hypothetical protein